MKKWIITLIALMAAVAVQADILASWDNDDLDGTESNKVADVTHTAVSSAEASRGFGLNASGSGYSDTLGAIDDPGWNGYATSVADAITDGNVFNINLAFSQSVTLTNMSIQLSAQNASDTAEAHFTLRSSLTGTTDLDTYVINPTNNSYTGINFSTDLSGYAQLDGINSVDFYLYVYNPDGNFSGYGQVGMGNAYQTDAENDLVFSGTVVPEPATVGMLGLGALVSLLVRRIRG